MDEILGRSLLLAHANVYEINLRQYSIEGTFTEFEKHLGRLKEMNINILWFMPLTPIGIEGRKMNQNDLGSYYAVKNYYQISREFGTMEEWKNLVVKMHEMGFKVIVDWVANHSSPDNPWATFHPEYYIRDDQGNILPPNEDWTDTRQLDYNNMEMRNAMIDAMAFWIKETGIDGFRCDMAKLLSTDFWHTAIQQLRAIKDVIMIAEGEDHGYYQAGFDAQYTWSIFHALTDLYSGNRSLKDFLNILDINRDLGDGFRFTFTSNHDENTWNGTEYDLFGDAVKCFTVFNFTYLHSLPMVYNGQEAGNKKRLSFFTKDVIDWQQNEMQDIFKKLNVLRKENETFHFRSSCIRIQSSNDDHIYAYLRCFKENKLFVILNMSGSVQQINFNNELISGEAVNYFTDQNQTIHSNYSTELNPWEFFIFTYP